MSKSYRCSKKSCWLKKSSRLVGSIFSEFCRAWSRAVWQVRFVRAVGTVWTIGFVVVLTLFVASDRLWAQTTISDGNRLSYSHGLCPSGDFIVESGGCFHIIPDPTREERTWLDRWIPNNFQITGTGFHYVKNDGTEVFETSGAIRVCVATHLESQITHNYFAGVITLAGDATVAIQDNKAQKNVYLTSLASLESAADARLTLSAKDSIDTICIVGDNDSFSNPVSIVGSGTVQIGKIDSASLTLYDHTNTSVTHSVTFDGASGSLGAAAITIAGDSTLRFQRTGEVAISNELSGSGKVEFDGDASYSFANDGGLTGVTGLVAINSQASLKVWTSAGQTSNSVKYGGDGTLVLGYQAGSNVIMDYSQPADLSNFQGTLFLADGYRWDPGASFKASYALGATHGGQFILRKNQNYSLDLYLEGMGKQKLEAYGAIRMTGQSSDSAMVNLAGTLYLMGDTRVSAANVAVDGTKHNKGMISAKITNADAESSAPLRICGLDFQGSFTQIILTGENDYGQTFIEGNSRLQIGCVGEVNGIRFDGSSGTLGKGNVVFTAVDGVSATDSDLGGTLLFSRSNDYAISNTFQGVGALEFGANGCYSLTDSSALDAFSGSILVADGASLTLSGQVLADSSSINLSNGALLGSGTLNGVLTMDAQSTLGSGMTLNQTEDLAMCGTYLVDLQNAKEGASLTQVLNKVTLADGSTLALLNDEGFELGDTVYLLEGAAGSFEQLDLASLVVEGAQDWELSLLTGENGRMILAASISLPEPSSFILLFSAVGMMLFWVKKRASARTA